jgi:putative peptidoglycan lipid II flippase
MFNVVMVVVVALMFGPGLDSFERSILLAAGIVAAALVQLLITGVAWLMNGRRWQPASIRVPDQTLVLFMRAIPGLIAAGIPQLKLIASAAIVSSSPAAVSWLYYGNRLYELPLSVASIAIAAVIVPRIASSVGAGGGDAFAEAQSRSFEIALGLALPAATGFALLAAPIAGGLFQRGSFTPTDTAAVAAALAAICAGLPGHVLEKVLGAVSFANEDTHTPMIAALCGLAAAIAGGVLLFPHYGYVGAAAAIAISGWVGASVLGAILYRRRWLRLDAGARRRLPRIVFATVIMGAVVWYAQIASHKLFPASDSSAGRLILLAALVALGVAVYAAALQIFGVAKLKDLVAAVRRQA